MSSNVWYQEVDMGLVNEIRSSVKYINESGEEVAIKPKAVWVRDPEEEFKEENYPCVTVSSLYDRFDPKRWSINPSFIGIDKPNNQIILQDPSVPYNLFYQIDFWARYKEDINCMTRTWLQNHNRAFNLTVTDDGGEVRSCNAIKNEDMKTSNLVKVGKRLFHSFISYSIWVELDPNINYNKPMVAVVSIDAQEQEGT